MTSKNSMRRFVRNTVLAASLAAIASNALAFPDLTAGTPSKKGGTMNFTVEKSDGTKVPIVVTIPASEDDDATRKDNKVDSIIEALSGNNINASRSGTTTTNKINVAGKKITLGTNTTGEVDTVAMGAGIDGTGSVGVCNWAGDINSIEIDDGIEPIYTASLGWEGFAVTSTVAYSDLSPANRDGLLIEIFNGWSDGLPAELQGNLQLDLGGAGISFSYPNGVTDAFIGGGNSSATSWGLFDIQSPVPEPGTLGLAAAGITLMSRRRRLMK